MQYGSYSKKNTANLPISNAADLKTTSLTCKHYSNYYQVSLKVLQN